MKAPLLQICRWIVAVVISVAPIVAQNLPQPPPINVHSGAVPGNRSKFKGPSTVGWVYVHPRYCTVYGSGSTFTFIVYLLEGGSFSTTSQQFEQLIEPACQTGNYLAFYIYDTSGHWSQVWTYTFQ